ncbi:MAG: transcription elongation factor GreA [bacterium]|nr:MAG: transcription elongation factor GreA [bacterium]
MNNLITEDGYKKLKSEFERLTSQRPEVIKSISVARAQGDLSENAEYHAAKERQKFLEEKISQIGERLSSVRIIKRSQINADKVSFGTTVLLYDIDNDSEITYRIVGQDESDPKKGMISITSPIGKALIGRSEEDEVEIKIPSGIKHFEIEKITV